MNVGDLFSAHTDDDFVRWLAASIQASAGGVAVLNGRNSGSLGRGPWFR